MNYSVMILCINMEHFKTNLHPEFASQKSVIHSRLELPKINQKLEEGGVH